MCVVNEGVVVGVIGTFPCEDNLVFVAVVAVNKAFVGIELCVITDAKGIVGITGMFDLDIICGLTSQRPTC